MRMTSFFLDRCAELHKEKGENVSSIAAALQGSPEFCWFAIPQPPEGSIGFVHRQFRMDVRIQGNGPLSLPGATIP